MKRTTRRYWNRLHRYAGLLFGLIFVILGLTGAIIAWLPELDAALNPELLRSDNPAPAHAVSFQPRQIQAVLDRLEQNPAYRHPDQLYIPANSSDVFVASYRQQLPAAWTTQARLRQVMVDPCSLRIKGERIWGKPGFSRPLLLPTLFHLHRYLLAGETGKLVIGSAGLALLLMTLAGLVLWWPPTLQALRNATRIAWRGPWPRLSYSLHRASGFLVAPALLVMAFSGSYFNLPQWIVPAVALVLPVSERLTAVSGPVAYPAQRISATDALYSAQQRFPEAAFSRITLPHRPTDAFGIRLRQPREPYSINGNTRISIDAYTAQPLAVRDPLQALPGDRLLNWQFPLHSGQAFGTPGKVFISGLGLLPLIFFVTGISIWRKKRRIST